MTLKELYTIFSENPIVTTDSRNITPSCLFFALRGDKFNGNEFAGMAIENGAAYAIIDDLNFKVNEKCILVDNVLRTLQGLAQMHRRQLDIPIIAITGTNGKTTTKELLNAVLSKKYKVAATKGNLNNHIGVPLTLLEMNSETELGIIEMGANHVGEIGELCQIAEPDYGIITNIGKAHLEGFGSFENVIKAKSELYQYLGTKGGCVFFNLDNEILKNEIAGLNTKTISYGTNEKANSIFTKVVSDPYLQLRSNEDKDLIMKTNLAGEYNFENVMAAATIGTYFGVDRRTIAQAFQDYIPQNNRSQIYNTSKNQLLLDCYNANPSSMEASIRNFSKTESKDRQKVLILGDMLELGIYSAEEHKKVIDFIEQNNFGNVILVGENFVKVNTNPSFKTFKTSEEALNFIKQNPLENKFILLKGSRGIRMEKIIEAV